MKGETLFEAVRNDNLVRLKGLLEGGSATSTICNTKDFSNSTLLMLAAYKCYVEIFIYLLEHVNDIDACDDFGSNALMYATASKSPNSAKIVEMLLIREAKPDYSFTHAAGSLSKVTPLMYAAGHGRTGTVNMLLKYGADINLTTARSGMTALMFAAKNGHEATARLLLEYGAADSINQADKKGMTALMYAEDNGHEAIVRLLLDKVADGSATDDVRMMSALSRYG